MSSIISILIISLSILIAVAFYTILERKILSYMQIRKGPNKVSIMGIMQPFSDALKLLTKSNQSSESMNSSMTMMFPSLALILSMVMFPAIPLMNMQVLDIQYNMILFMMMSSLLVYMILLTGWATNSKYSYMGSIRNVAQMISYEISLFLVILITMFMSHSFNMIWMQESQIMLWFITGLTPIFLMWITICLAETNRSPFDFAEGESELVSGFNVEYSGGFFALIFLAEYSSMILLSFITAILFSNINQMPLTPTIIMMILLWTRATLPRFRYDLLMNLNWKMFLPMTIITLMPTSILALLYPF